MGRIVGSGAAAPGRSIGGHDVGPRAERMSADERAELQARRLDDLVGRLAERSPLYRQRLASAGVARRPGRPRRAGRPAVHHQAGPVGRLPLGPAGRPPRTGPPRPRPSGTGGRPTLVAYSRADLEIWAQVCARALGCAGAGPGTICHNAYGYGLFTGGLGMHAGAELMGCTLVPVSGGQTQRQVTLLRDLRPEVLCCTPSYAARLGRRWARRAWPPPRCRCGSGSSGPSPGARPCAPRSRRCCP